MKRTIADVGSATPFQIHISACDFFQRTRIPQLFQKHIRNHLLSPAFHRSPHTRRSCGCFPTNHSSSGGNRSATSAKSASNKYGEHYSACEICSRNQNPAGVVYVTEQGNRYHNLESCSGMKRSVRLVKASSVSEMGACSRCG